MEGALLAQIMELKNKPLEELRAKYAELFKSEATSNNRAYLWRKLTYRMQELAYGGLSEETQGRINDLIERYDPVNNKSLRPDEAGPDKGKKKSPSSHDRRLPIPGTVITKEYKGKSLSVKVLLGGFEFNGKAYKSLTAVAKEVTGAHWNGYLFFNL